MLSPKALVRSLERLLLGAGIDGPNVGVGSTSAAIGCEWVICYLPFATVHQKLTVECVGDAVERAIGCSGFRVSIFYGFPRATPRVRYNCALDTRRWFRSDERRLSAKSVQRP